MFTDEIVMSEPRGNVIMRDTIKVRVYAAVAIQLADLSISNMRDGLKQSNLGLN
jgi:hypothetical protein